MPVKGSYLALAGLGGILLWSGTKGTRWSDTLRNIISGQGTQNINKSYPITSPNLTPDGSSVTSVGGQPGSLAATYENYVGRVPYVWGGANPRGWDCSGSYNYIANHDCGIPIPGYGPHRFTGQTHGPNTLVYQFWLPTHANMVGRNSVQPNDICLWQTHMGVAVNGTEYASAFDTQLGTTIQPIHGGGPVGEVVTIWRLR